MNYVNNVGFCKTVTEGITNFKEKKAFTFLTYDSLPISILKSIQVIPICRVNTIFHNSC